MNVGVMKDYKLRDLHASHTLGWFFVYYESTGLVVELEHRKIVVVYYESMKRKLIYIVRVT
jgi:hypothetical protein